MFMRAENLFFYQRYQSSVGLLLFPLNISFQASCFCLLFSVCIRTESVAEKMLTNWFTFLLYKFLKVRNDHSH